MNSAKALLDLQATDQKLAEKRRTHLQVVAKLEARGGLDELREKTERGRVRVLETRLEVGRLESDSASLKERVSALEERLYSGTITNVRELTAVETEHNSAKRQSAQVEEALGPAQAAAIQARERHDEIRTRLALQEDTWSATEKELSERRFALNGECQMFGRQRMNAAREVPAHDLAQYESLLVRKSGVAVARVIRGVCQGCRVRLPLKEISRLRSTSGLVSCGTCGRILLPE